ncbi:MAG: threonylcarbamoyl-AMP synthase [Candidatus Omnitrophica bacterium]|nr:threonylcarbamoyl-AMP synthase [Candidatus Omnitrophota bacterium]
MTQTRIIKVDPLNPAEDSIRIAADTLRAGGLAIIPTETVYGIAANALDEKAMQRLSEIKKRPEGKPFTLHIADKEKVEEFAAQVPVSAYKLLERFWPGPLTLVLKSKTALGTVGLRMPDNEVALEVIGLAGIPVACPSANLSGKPAPANFSEAIRDLEGLVDLALDAGDTKVGVESTVVDLTLTPLRVLREGAIRKEEIEKAAGRKCILFICTGNSCRSVMAKALLEKKLKDAHRQDVEVLSAGTMMLGGLGATEPTRELLAQDGIDVSGHVSKRATAGMVKKSDLILVMEKIHEERILELVPEAKNRVFLLKEFAKIEDTENLDIEDPIGRGADFYAETFEIIKEAIGRLVKSI